MSDPRMQKYTGSVIWSLALLLLFFMDTGRNGVSLCLFRLLGFDACPGCDIGHSIHEALHLHFRQSWNEHILGMPATIAILYYICKPFFHYKKTSHYGFSTAAHDLTGITTR